MQGHRGHQRAPHALEASPTSLLRSLRGTIVGAQIAHPRVLHVEARDARGELWRLSTQDSSWLPTESDRLPGRLIEGAEIDQSSGAVRLRLSGGGALDIEPNPEPGQDDPPAWELITPSGLVLEFGPGIRWRVLSV